MIELNYAGRMANRLIEYLFALVVHNKTKCGITCPEPIPGFPNVKDRQCESGQTNNEPKYLLSGQKPVVSVEGPDDVFRRSEISYEQLFEIAKSHDIRMQGYFQRMDFLSPHIELAREVCYSEEEIHPQIGPIVDYQNDLVIHLRYGDIHMNRLADKISWTHKPLEIHEVLGIYNKIKSEVDVKQVWLVCEDSNDPFVHAIAHSLPHSFIVSVNPVHDFVFVSKFKHVFMSPSTFSLMAAWTSTISEKIYFPLVGAFHPKSRMLPNADPPEHRFLLWINDPRFIYIDVADPELTFMPYDILSVEEVL
jgi:hypothetical protein